MLIKTPLLHQSLGPHVFLSVCLSFSLSLFLADSLERESQLHNPGNISLFPSCTLSSWLQTTRFVSNKGPTSGTQNGLWYMWQIRTE